MLLDHIVQVGLLSRRPDSDVLSVFPLPARKSIISTVIQNVSDGQTLITPFHVHWVMECIGQAFALPIEEADIIEKALSIYTSWMFNTNGPPPILENEKAFLHEIFRHLSVVFETKGVKQTRDIVLLSRQASICTSVLECMLNVARKKHLAPEIWEQFLRVLLGICDSLLRLPNSDPSLENMLTSSLLKTLFEIWLRSQITAPHMWSELHRLCVNWTHRAETIDTVSAVSMALTQRAVRVLCGVSQGADGVTLPSAAGNRYIDLDLPDEFVVFAWYRMLYMLGNPSDIPQPANHLAAVMGLSQITDVFLSIGSNFDPRGPSNQPVPPQTNMLLHLLGDWLFEAALHPHPLFFEGRAQACGALCRIFCARLGTIQPTYLARFYRVLYLGLHVPLCFAAITLNSPNLFTLELEGAYMLVPAFLTQIKSLLRSADTSADMTSLRRACITLLGSLLSLPNRFGDTPIDAIPASALAALQQQQQQFGFDVDPTAATAAAMTFADLKPLLRGTLLLALDNEQDTVNTQLLLQSLCVFAFEETAHGQAAVVEAAHAIVAGVVLPAKRAPEVLITALEVLSSMATLSTSLLPSDQDISRWLVEQLCEFVIVNVDNLYAGKRTISRLGTVVSEALFAMSEWLMHTQRLLSESAVLQRVLQALEMSIMGFINQKDLDQGPRKLRISAGTGDLAEIRDTALAIQRQLLLLAGRFPSAVGGAARISSQHQEGQRFRAYVIGSDTVLTLSETVLDDGSSGVTAIVRDRAGRFAWDAGLRYTPKTQRERSRRVAGPTSATAEGADDTDTQTSESQGETPTTTPVLPAARLETPPGGRLSSLASSIAASEPLTDRTAADPDVLRVALEKQATLDKSMSLLSGIAASTMPVLSVKNRAYMYFDMISKRRDPTPQSTSPASEFTPVRPLETESAAARDMLQSRLLAANLQLLSVQSIMNRKIVTMLDSDQKLLRLLRHLDKQHERECMKVGVMYVAAGQNDQYTVLQNEGGSEDYHQFLESLGWPVELASHTGFRGGLDRNGSVGTISLYFASAGSEVMFHVPTLMPNNAKDPQQIHKKRHVGNDHVHIVWSEHSRDYNPATITSQFNFVHVVVYPLQNGLCRVRVHKRQDTQSIPAFGPLQDHMVVSRRVVGQLARLTAMHGNHAVHTTQKLYLRPAVARQRVIDEIMSKCKRSDLPAPRLYTQLFAPELAPFIPAHVFATSTTTATRTPQSPLLAVSGRSPGARPVSQSLSVRSSTPIHMQQQQQQQQGHSVGAGAGLLLASSMTSSGTLSSSAELDD